MPFEIFVKLASFVLAGFTFFYTTKERLCSIEDDCLLKFYQGRKHTTLSFPL